MFALFIESAIVIDSEEWVGSGNAALTIKSVINEMKCAAHTVCEV
jgi:hypothetical protein